MIIKKYWHLGGQNCGVVEIQQGSDPGAYKQQNPENVGKSNQRDRRMARRKLGRAQNLRQG